MIPNILQSIAPEFIDFVMDKKFSIAKAETEPKEFGNTFIILDSPTFKLRIYADRGQRFIDISNDGKNWHKLEYVLEFLDSACSQEYFGEPPQFEKLAIALKRNLQKITDLLTADLAASGLIVFEKQKSEELMSRIFRSHLNEY